MPSLTLQDVSEELRYRAGRLRQEMDLPCDPSSSDDKGTPVWLCLGVAMIDAVRDEWEGKLGKAWPELMDRAKTLAAQEHTDVNAIVGGISGQAPCIARVPRLSRRDNAPRLGEVLVTSYNLVGMRPIWAHYVQEARESLEADAGMEGG